MQCVPADRVRNLKSRRMTIKKAIIPAAGFGTRMLPAAKAVPKEMLPVLDRPTIQYVVEEAAAGGVDDVLLVTSREKRAIEDHFDRSPELERRLNAEPEPSPAEPDVAYASNGRGSLERAMSAGRSS